MGRELNAHKVNGCNEKISIEVLDEPGAGGASHLYFCSWPSNKEGSPPQGRTIDFQNGPILEVGTNGLTHEVLLAIVIDRLQCFQKGAFASRENALALTKIEEAMHWLHHRTRERVNRGVEGTHKH